MVTAKITVMLKNGILDSQGKTVHHALENLGFGQIEDVRMGKVIELKFNGISREEAEALTAGACNKLLANPVIEDYRIELVEDKA